MSRSDKSARFAAADIANLAGRFFPSGEAEVVDFELRPFSNEALGYLGLHELLAVEARDSVDKPNARRLTFFVKSVLPTRNEFDVKIFAEESTFFRDAAPRLLEGFKSETWSAACYMVTDESIVLEDLGAAGFQVPKGQLTVSQVKAAVACTARLHASSLLLESRMKQPLGQVYPDHFREKTFIDSEYYSWQWLLSGIEVLEAIAGNMGLDPKYVLPAYKIMLEIVNVVEGGRNVLRHGDLWSKNLMFNEEGCCRLVDFQMVTYASYVLDLLQLIYLNIDRNTRNILEKDLIKFYHSVLSETLRGHGYDEDKIVTLQEVFQDFEKMKIAGLVTAAQFFPIALLNKELTDEFSKDSEMEERYKYESRKVFVMRAMQIDANYKQRLEESVEELIEYMENREKNSS